MDAKSRRDNRRGNRRKKGLLMDNLLLIILALVLAAACFFCYVIWGNVDRSVKLEAGQTLEPSDFLVMDWGMKVNFGTDASYVDMSDIGSYIVHIRYHGNDFYSKLQVVDTLTPVVTVQDATVYSDALPDPWTFIRDVQDGTDVTVTYVQQPDMTREGNQEVQLCVTDCGGNTAFATADMTLILDLEAPKILGVNKFSLYQDSTISYRSGVIVTDNYDESPELTIDSSRVDLSKVGTYDVIYRATDAAGNVTTLTTTVTVEEKPEYYVDEAVINAKADEILATFITDDMTAREQAEAIWDWVDENCTYHNYSDKVDRMQAAYIMMTDHYGDCFNYFAICSVFFERLGIPQINVVRSPESVRPTKHYWSLVSVDGGQTYYHFDVCPQPNFDIRVCLFTDAEVAACNQYAAGYYTMDEGVYPTTPLE